MFNSYNIIETYGEIGRRTDNDGVVWIRELNLISWNGREPLFDVREWNEDRTVMRAGARFNRAELDTLTDILIRKREAENVGTENK